MAKGVGATFKHLPKHSLSDRSQVNYNGIFTPNTAVFVRSGSVEGITGGTTGSVQLSFDASALRLIRVEAFHSGAATAFNLRLENRTPNTGSFFDPRFIVACYDSVPGSPNYSQGLDQIEGDMIALTDCEPGKIGNLYLKFMPHGSGDNAFKYLLFFEAVMIHINRAGDIHI